VAQAILLVLAAVVALAVITVLFRSVRVVPQQRMDVVERLGKYQRTLRPGLNLLVPFVDAVRSKVDMREQVVSFPPQPVITSDNLVVSIDTVLYFKVVDPVRATYEIANFLQAIEQLTVTTLRNVIGSLDLEKALTSREEINRHLSGVLDETTGRWGIKVTRVEIKAIEPPPSIRDSMEKQMRAERDRRAAILNAEGHKQAQILTAEGEKQAAVLRAEGDRASRILTAEGQAKAIKTVFDAIHTADPNPQVLAYQYMQALPQIAAGQSNKVWIVPVELTRALEGIGGALGGLSGMGVAPGVSRPEVDEAVHREVEQAAQEAAEEARAAATSAADAAKEASIAVGGPGDVSGVTEPTSPSGPAVPADDETQQIEAAPHAPAGALLEDQTQPIRMPGRA
jgi:regulator of protease activity HflC (stomatin/prohibitin superfamily)